MIKRLFQVCFVVLLWTATAVGQKQLTLDHCFTTFQFYPASASVDHFTADGLHYLKNEEGTIAQYRLLNDSMVATIVPATVLAKVEDMDNFEVSDYGKVLLLRGNSKPVYRHSVLADYWVYNLNTRTLDAVFNEKGAVQYAALSPDGGKVAFVAGNNLYYKDLSTGKTMQITTDGERNKVINGLADWVYEEEFSSTEGSGMVAAAWSPDGEKIAFIRFDETQVPEAHLTWYENEAYPRYSAFKYPKVGTNNSKVSAHVYDLKTGLVLCASTPDCGITVGAKALEQQDLYIPRIYWTPDNELCVYRLNRYQNELILSLYDPKSQQIRTIHTESDAAYVDLEVCNKPYFLNKNGQYMWLSERDGHTHVYLQDKSSAKTTQLTKGDWDVMEFFGVDETKGTFYFQAATPSPRDRQIWEGYLDGRAAKLLTPEAGTSEAKFSPTFEHFICTWSDNNTPPVVTCRNRTGQVVKTMVDNNRVRNIRNSFQVSPKTAWTFKTTDSTLLYGTMIKPRNFDPAKQYPVLFDIYGGPNSQTTQNNYDGYFDTWRQMLAQKGYIVVSVDNRGTGGRGRDFKKCTQLQLGKLETEDQIAAARYLATQPYVDARRIGIWGWSFGGYLSSSCVLKGADVFKMAIAVAPVTNWKWYDSAYTERFMHTIADNSKGYEDNSPVNFAHLLKGDNYLLCHGMADDNVHWQHSVEMTNALIKANKQFDTYSYPNRNHGIYGDNATIHLFTKLTNFITEKL
jgi:dipeptidyl-peptidase 4